MVNNDTQILDDGELKEYVIKGIKAMPKKYPDSYEGRRRYHYDLWLDVQATRAPFLDTTEWDEELEDMVEKVIDNPNFKSISKNKRMMYADRKKTEQEEENFKNRCDGPDPYSAWFYAAGEETILKHLGRTKFKKSVMLNISPHWPEECKTYLIDGEDRLQYIYILRGLLKKLMDQLLNLKWFTDYEYVIETGKRGNHPHVHAVAEVNEALHKQFNTWIKSNWTKSVNEIWKKVIRGSTLEEAVGSAMKGSKCCQRNIINCPIMLQDKKDYLREELKPEDHKNLNKEESLFTSKNI